MTTLLGRRVAISWLALVGIVVWLGGVEVMPNLHLAMHGTIAPHVHDGDRTIFLEVPAHAHDESGDEDAEVDEHGQPVHHDVATSHDEGDEDAEVDEHGAPVHHEHADHARAEQALAIRLQHGAHSFAHHSAALHPAPVAALAPLPFDRYVTRLRQTAIIEPSSFSVPEAAARGPPSLFA